MLTGGGLPAREDCVWRVVQERSGGEDAERQTAGGVPQHPQQQCEWMIIFTLLKHYKSIFCFFLLNFLFRIAVKLSIHLMLAVHWAVRRCLGDDPGYWDRAQDLSVLLPQPWLWRQNVLCYMPAGTAIQEQCVFFFKKKWHLQIHMTYLPIRSWSLYRKSVTVEQVNEAIKLSTVQQI